MAEPDLTNDFNSTNDFFNSLFRLFTSGPSTPAAAGGDSLFNGISNFLRFLFSSFGGQESPPAAAPPAPAPAPTPVQSKAPARGVMGTIRDAFAGAANRVQKIYEGAAFNISSAVQRLTGSCNPSPTGYCLASINRALTTAGLDFNGRSLRDVMPDRNGSRWAKDLAPVLAADNRFDTVASGHGARFNGGYQPQVGDIAVWTGARYGHTQMFTGYDQNGQQVWISDFKTSAHNWTGLRDPESHGEFKIFRQKSSDTMLAAAQPAPAPSPRPDTLTI